MIVKVMRLHILKTSVAIFPRTIIILGGIGRIRSRFKDIYG